MSGNISPIFSKVGDIQGGHTFTTQMTSGFSGSDANAATIWTSDATNGGYLQRIRFKATGTNVNTVARFFIYDGVSNYMFYGEMSLPSTTASSTFATNEMDYNVGIAMPPGYSMIVGLGTTVAAGWVAVGIGGKY